MTTDRISMATDAELGRRIREAAQKSGTSISAWLESAAEARLRNEALGEALDEYQREYGAFTDAELAEAEAWIDGKQVERRTA